MKAFSFSTKTGEIRIGVKTEAGSFNFTHAWEMFKQIKAAGKGPDFHFLQMMIELDFFSTETVQQVLGGLKEYRTLDDLKLEDDVRFEVPIARPQKILCIGKNYKKHAEEFGSKVPEEPMFFSKVPSALLAHEWEIVIPSGIGRVDHELELAVIIGKSGKYISAAKAMEYVAAYTVVNDVTARDMQGKDTKSGKPWVRSKGFDTFCPMGPYVIPKDDIDDVYSLNMELRVNGEVRQKATLADMIYKIPTLIEFLSRHMTLNPGDIICTGTPEGVSPIKPGDVIEAEIDRIGILRNTVIAEN